MQTRKVLVSQQSQTYSKNHHWPASLKERVSFWSSIIVPSHSRLSFPSPSLAFSANKRFVSLSHSQHLLHRSLHRLHHLLFRLLFHSCHTRLLVRPSASASSKKGLHFAPSASPPTSAAPLLHALPAAPSPLPPQSPLPFPSLLSLLLARTFPVSTLPS
jgi:hypothetical protein